ncbi:MAG: lipoate--protein ligase [Solobacterium sp.]|nr:lipoate--protein ligase [Solobacterium sp.]
MIKQLSVIHSAGSDPVRNLALESLLMDLVGPEEMILYLWQNDRTIVIGKNQNLRKECELARIEQDGIQIVRRSSGGGAVYHDLGNLNFSFIAHDDNYDVKRQTEILCSALAQLGIEAAVSGRNDVLCQGRKVSGNAYYHHNGVSLHHGTLLIDTDMAAMKRYLRADEKKLRARGVDSIRSRVMNLKEVCPSLSVEDASAAIIRACEAFYECAAEEIPMPDETILHEKIMQFGSAEWIRGKEVPFEEVKEHRFPWGGIRMEFHVVHGIISDVSIWSDSMEPDTIDAAAASLTGCRYQTDEICRRLMQLPDTMIRNDVTAWLQREEEDAV